MKKSIIALALVLSVGLALNAADAFARWGGPGHGGGHRMGGGYGMGCNFAGAQNNPEFQKFLDATKDLRAALAGDRGELQALMSSQNPDPARARALSESIFTKRTQIAEKARAMNVTWGCRGRGAGYGPGYGPRVGCDGTGPGPRAGGRK